MRLAVLTVLPHKSYENLVNPMTPATTGPGKYAKGNR